MSITDIPATRWEVGMSDLVNRAIRFAKETHQRIDQRRKYSNQPYSVHLEQVAKIVTSVTDDQEIFASAWLHDSAAIHFRSSAGRGLSGDGTDGAIISSSWVIRRLPEAFLVLSWGKRRAKGASVSGSTRVISPLSPPGARKITDCM